MVQSIKITQQMAQKVLQEILEQAFQIPALKRRVPSGRAEWKVEVQLVGASTMRQLNAAYRKKDQPTDVLSFPAPEIFVRQGHLGELIICLPVLRRQAKEVKHSERAELRVLLVHGVLHLLGLDHEAGRRAALTMSRWEGRLLGSQRPQSQKLGLIRRVS